MKIIAIILLFVSIGILVASFALPAYGIENLISKQYGFFIVAPPGWRIDTSTADQIVLVDLVNDSIYASIKKYKIEDDKQIASEDDLIQAIAGLYRNLGMEIKDLGAIKYALTESEAVFEIEFDSFDSNGILTHRKYLKGTIGRSKDEGQLLYLMIAVAPKEFYDAALPKFRMIAKSFHITAELSSSLFPKHGAFKYLMIFIILVLSVFFFTRNRRVQKSPNPLGRDSVSFWRCDKCGRMNHIETKFCHRCGNERNLLFPLKNPLHSSTSSIKTPPQDAG
jgi:hypothetical protein